jgi:sugar lactone lactonase YvrE
MRHAHKVKYLFGIALAAAVVLPGAAVFAQADSNNAPNPYRLDEGWAKTAMGRNFGSTIGITPDSDGKSIWTFDRCGGNDCANSKIAPIQKFDASGKLVTSFGAGMFNYPHGLYVDREGNVWVSDNRGTPPKEGKPGKGHTVWKFSPEGKVLMTLGTPGVAGTGQNEFNAPSDIMVAANGDIFVADGHGEKTNARIVKFSKDGKFIKAWGKAGKGPGEFDEPHSLAMDSAGRLFVADRANNRIQIFDQEGKFLAEWKQFGRPSGIFIDKKDMIYVADSESESVSKNHDGWKRGIRVGRVRDGVVTGFIPDPVERTTGTSAAEGVAADAQGNIYGAEVGPKRLMKYIKN